MTRAEVNLCSTNPCCMWGSAGHPQELTATANIYFRTHQKPIINTASVLLIWHFNALRTNSNQFLNKRINFRCQPYFTFHKNLGKQKCWLPPPSFLHIQSFLHCPTEDNSSVVWIPVVHKLQCYPYSTFLQFLNTYTHCCHDTGGLFSNTLDLLGFLVTTGVTQALLQGGLRWVVGISLLFQLLREGTRNNEENTRLDHQQFKAEDRANGLSKQRLNTDMFLSVT